MAHVAESETERRELVEEHRATKGKANDMWNAYSVVVATERELADLTNLASAVGTATEALASVGDGLLISVGLGTARQPLWNALAQIEQRIARKTVERDHAQHRAQSIIDAASSNRSAAA